jgi:hypothetical protein
MSRKSVLILVLVFLAGLAAGVAGSRLLRTGAAPGSGLLGAMTEVVERLSLTPEQRSRVEAILRAHTPRAEAVMQEAGERLRAISDSLDRELRAVLLPAQRVLLDSLRRTPIVLKRKTAGPGGVTRIDTLVRP